MSKEEIRDRMLLYCSRFLGLNSSALVDPIIKLFIEALSEEIYQLRGEIDALQERILNTISTHLVPDVNLLAQPAHAILQVNPIYSVSTINSNDCFVVNTSTRNQHNTRNKETELYPIGDCDIITANVKYIKAKESLYKYSQYDKKLVVCAKESHQLKWSDKNESLWIGVEIDKEIVSLDKLLFFVDFPFFTNKMELLNMLFYAPWTLADKRLTLKRGGQFANKKNETVIDFLMSLESIKVIHDKIEEYYYSNFIEVENLGNVKDYKCNYPNCFTSFFTTAILEKMQEESLLWIEVELPKEFNQEYLENMSLFLNCFPVLNKQKHSMSVSLNPLTKLIKLPISKESFFLEIESVKDSNGKVYCDVQFKDTSEQLYGTYTLRQGGYEKYNSNDANDYLENLGEFLVTESHRMANGASTDENVRRVYQILQDLIQYIQKKTVVHHDKIEHQVYVVLDELLDKDEIFYINYWTTEGHRINELDSMTPVLLGSLNALNVDNITLQTSFMGGLNEPSKTQKKEKQKEGLEKLDVITNDLDIEVYCRNKFKTIIDEVLIKKGFMHTQEEGFIKTIDVFLKTNKNISNFLTQKNVNWFKVQLERVSPENYCYRVFLNQ